MISVVVLTKNSEKTLKKCLESITWSREVIVVDDESSDSTVSIAKQFGAHIFTHPVQEDFASQRNYALNLVTGEWVLFVDSDEVVSTRLAESIQKTIGLDNEYRGYFIRRNDYVFGKPVHKGEFGANRLLRFARKTAGKWEGKVHERWVIDGEAGELEGEILHYSHDSIESFLKKIDLYTSIRAKELFESGVKSSFIDILMYPSGKFIRNYISQSGFRDGTLGFLLATLMSFHSFLVRANCNGM